MKKTDIANKATRMFHKIGFECKKHSPEILVVAGTVGLVASAVLACKATLKVNEVTEEAKENLGAIHTAIESEETDAGKPYSKEDGKKDLTIVYVQTGVKLVKLYGPALALGTVSITSILSGHNIMRKRYAATTAAYTALSNSFKDYRSRVVERFGAELDKELKYNIKAKEVEVTEVDEKGKEKTVTKTVNVIDPNTIDDMSRIFYDGNIGFNKDDPGLTLLFLKGQQAHANDLLKSRGYLFLNDVYEMLGFSKTAAGQVFGWYYDEKHPVGDNFVDFGIYNINDEAKARFLDGREKGILLEFNHDGNILKYM